MPDPSHRLLLLRHGPIASHRGDVPVTGPGLEAARRTGQDLAGDAARIRVLTASTLRARQTATALAEGARSAGAAVPEPRLAFALRNPDLYVAGERVDMVSSPGALAAQVPGMSEQDASTVPFFVTFFGHPDRIGWWLRLAEVPGDDAATVARRIACFAASLADRRGEHADLTVGVTHSPVLRAAALANLGRDPGEPEWLTGLEVSVGADRSVVVRPYPGG